MTKEIKIPSKDQVFTALVDDEDYPVVSRHKWYILWSKELPYAFTKLYNESGKGKTFLMHHLILGSSAQVDHENHNTLDARKENMRPATHQTNGWNKGKPNWKGKKSTSRFKGVSYRPLRGKPRWLAYFKHVEEGKHKSTGKYVWVGYYDTEIEAAKAYNEAIVKYRGSYAWVNPLPEDEVSKQAISMG